MAPFSFLIGSGNGRVAPGLYTTSVPAGGFCYWARLRGTSGSFNDIITNDVVTRGRAFLLVGRSDRAVKSDGCGSRLLASGKSYNPNPTRMADGQYRVNIDVAPGTYRAAGGSRCYWEPVRRGIPRPSPTFWPTITERDSRLSLSPARTWGSPPMAAAPGHE